MTSKQVNYRATNKCCYNCTHRTTSKKLRDRIYNALFIGEPVYKCAHFGFIPAKYAICDLFKFIGRREIS